jgi:hypothetical protein
MVTINTLTGYNVRHTTFFTAFTFGGFAGKGKFAFMLNWTPGHEGEWRDGDVFPRNLTERLSCVINIAASIRVQISTLKSPIRTERLVLFLMHSRSLLG